MTYSVSIRNSKGAYEKSDQLFACKRYVNLAFT